MRLGLPHALGLHEACAQRSIVNGVVVFIAHPWGDQQARAVGRWTCSWSLGGSRGCTEYSAEPRSPSPAKRSYWTSARSCAVLVTRVARSSQAVLRVHNNPRHTHCPLCVQRVPRVRRSSTRGVRGGNGSGAGAGAGAILPVGSRRAGWSARAPAKGVGGGGRPEPWRRHRRWSSRRCCGSS